MEALQCCTPGGEQVDLSSQEAGKSVARTWLRVGIALVIAGQTMIFGLAINVTPPAYGTPIYWGLHGALFLSSWVVIALLAPPLVRATWSSLKAKTVTIEGLFLLSMVGALVGSAVSSLKGEGAVYYEVVAVVLAVYTVGKTLGRQSREKALRELEVIQETFNYAYLETACGKRERVDVECVTEYDRIVVAPGEPITVDGIILEGRSFVDEIAMTGEPSAVCLQEGDRVLAGTYAVDGQLIIAKIRGKRQLDDVIHTIQNARTEPSRYEAQADKIMVWFLPIVILVSGGTFFYWLAQGAWSVALFNAMAVLLVACPCALGLATPLAIWGGLWKMASLGVVARSGEIIDTLATVDRVVFDKTGTLSEGSLVLEHTKVMDVFKDKSLWIKGILVLVEQSINHPVARALLALESQETREAAEGWRVARQGVIPGQGIDAEIVNVNGERIRVRVGTQALMSEGADHYFELGTGKKAVYLSIDGELAAMVTLQESLRAEVQEVFERLSQAEVALTILTGDPDPRWSEISKVAVNSGLTPGDKVREVRLMQERGESVVFVGDGVNDAPAMAVASGALAMGGGAALTCSNAGGVLMGESLLSIEQVITLARALRRRLRGNLFFAAMYNGIGMTLAACGMLHPVVAALLMVGSSAFVSFRVLSLMK